MVQENTFSSKYLNSKSSSFKSIQVKFKNRTGVGGLSEDLRCQQRDSAMCTSVVNVNQTFYILIVKPTKSQEAKCIWYKNGIQ